MGQKELDQRGVTDVGRIELLVRDLAPKWSKTAMWWVSW